MADIVLRMTKIQSCTNIKYQGLCVPDPPTGERATGTGNVLTYHMRNFTCQSIDLDSPVTTIRLPQEGSDKTITIKVEGNLETMSVGWTLIDETTPTTLVDEFDGMCSRPAVVLTVCDQLDFLFNTIENKTIDNEYDMFLGCSDINNCITPPLSQAQSTTAFDASSLFKRHVKIIQLTVTKTGRTPITYAATMRLVIGTPEITVSEETT